MKITIFGDGEDPEDKLVHYDIVVDNDRFKGSADFYGYVDTFDELVSGLQNFPFESSKPLELSVDHFEMKISLADPAGRINVKISIDDGYGNSSTFTDQTVETPDLQRLASKLKHTDFSIGQKFEWS